eukprot:gb/GEZN01005282.1/.p1 GENE.gb/GEZN01005282.1/~~gb/GEZN01005282.1/.p1  ORF type:complete len:588 (-),score=62.81 gb/GEZN01005282.1/:20-1783(-)
MSRPISKAEKAEQLIQMGFTKEQVTKALMSTQWNLEAAVSRLLNPNQPGAPNPPKQFPLPAPPYPPMGQIGGFGNINYAAPMRGQRVEEELQRGIVKTIREEGRYGFVNRSYGPDLFFHFSEVVGDQQPQLGDHVEFLEGKNKKDPSKLCCYRVRIVNSARTSPLSSQRHLRQPAALPPLTLSLRASSLLGKIIWLQPKYGFIEENHKRFFFFVSQLRSGTGNLVVGAIAEFTLQEEPVVGLVAKDLRLIDVRGPAENDLIRDSIFRGEEDRETEFKAFTRSLNPGSSVGLQEVCKKYVNAFLNSNGGVLYIGIEDDGAVKGIRINRKDRDLFRLYMDSEMKGTRPTVGPSLYRIDFLPVFRRVSPRWSYVEQIQDFCVIMIDVKKGTETVYQTKNDNKSYLRRDGSIHEMTAEMIRARVKEEQNIYMQSFIKDMIAKGMLQLPGQPNPEPPRQAGETFEISPRQVDELVGMGFQRSRVLECLYEFKEQGIMKPGVDQIIDRLAPSMVAQAGNPDSQAARGPDVPQIADQAAAIADAEAAASKPPEPSPIQSEEANDLLPCQFCRILLPFESLMSHQERCVKLSGRQ